MCPGPCGKCRSGYHDGSFWIKSIWIPNGSYLLLIHPISSQTRVFEIQSNENLRGTVPAINSSKLEIIILNDNGFSGSISWILPLPEYPSLRVAAFHSNNFRDDDIGPLLHKLFQNSSKLQSVTLYDNDRISGHFPSFDKSVHLPLFQILALHGLSLKGSLPSNLYFGENVSSHSLTLFGNRLSGEMPFDLLPHSPNDTILVFPGNMFSVKHSGSPTNWVDNAMFIGVSALYLELDPLNFIKRNGLLCVSTLCLLCLFIKRFHTFWFMKYSDIHFVETVKIIDRQLTNHRLLLIICVMLIIYAFNASYYTDTPILDHFSLF